MKNIVMYDYTEKGSELLNAPGLEDANVYTSATESPALYEYTTQDSVIYREFVQYCKELETDDVHIICFFLALKDMNNNVIEDTLWTEDLVDKQANIYKSDPYYKECAEYEQTLNYALV